MMIPSDYVGAIKLVKDELGTDLQESREIMREWCRDSEVPFIKMNIEGRTVSYPDWPSITIGKATQFVLYVRMLRDAKGASDRVNAYQLPDGWFHIPPTETGHHASTVVNERWPDYNADYDDLEPIAVEPGFPYYDTP